MGNHDGHIKEWIEFEYQMGIQDAECAAENAWLIAAESGTAESWAEEDEARSRDFWYGGH